jgi:hypothetical protein
MQRSDGVSILLLFQVPELSQFTLKLSLILANDGLTEVDMFSRNVSVHLVIRSHRDSPWGCRYRLCVRRRRAAACPQRPASAS